MGEDEHLEMAYEDRFVVQGEEVEHDDEYCDLCEEEGHSFHNCPARDDEEGEP